MYTSVDRKLVDKSNFKAAKENLVEKLHDPSHISIYNIDECTPGCHELSITIDIATKIISFLILLRNITIL